MTLFIYIYIDLALNVFAVQGLLRPQGVALVQQQTDGQHRGVPARAQRAEGTAALLAIGTATPTNVFYQAEYPDYYFRVTNSEHRIELKDKFRRICDKTRIRKRYMHLNEDILAANPSIAAAGAASLNARQDILAAEVPKLGKKATDKAIDEWGQPKSRITHLVFCTSAGVDMPGADLKLANLLGLSRVMLYNLGCYSGGTVLRVAKDLSENNRGARVLVVCSELTAITFHAPSEANPDNLVGQALFADRAAALVVSADPDPAAERALFRIVHAHQSFLPDSEEALVAHLRESGLVFGLSKEAPDLISENIEKCLEGAFRPLGMMCSGPVDWNSLFWAAHPGGARILSWLEAKIGLREEKMRATWHVLGEYGNMYGASVLFVLDEMRKWSAAEGKTTTGEGLDWGVLIISNDGLGRHSMPIV